MLTSQARESGETTMTTITAQDLHDQLVDEGHDPDQVTSVIDQCIAAGLELDQPDDGCVLSAGEVDVIRAQLAIGDYGTLMDADTADPIGPATRTQRDASLAARTYGGAGTILVDDDGTVIPAGGYGADQARRCYVTD